MRSSDVCRIRLGRVHGTWTMMLHPDFEVSDPDAAAAHAVGLGATVAGYRPQQRTRAGRSRRAPLCLY
ncbi:VOC family protein [Salinispora tropica]|uniref:VOC family protein n=1 Tax=Salinispora tropica TaxID=168695 RepID=UPI0018B00C46|nr:VOC family protein [Salinispora tropica]